MAKIDICRDWYERVWINGDVDAVDEFMGSDIASSDMVPDHTLDREEIKVVVEALRAQVRDLDVTINHHIEDGDWISIHLTVTGTSRTSGNKINATGQCMMRFEGQCIVETYNHFDFVSYFQQAGLLAPHAMEMGMMGEPMH